MIRRPSANGSNGRTAGGRFAHGNPGGPGNPHARQVARLRARVLECVTPEDIERAVRKLVELAHSGNLAAIKELLDRTIGKLGPAPDDDEAAEPERPMKEIMAEIEKALAIHGLRPDNA